jgi:hypothetical protein
MKIGLDNRSNIRKCCISLREKNRQIIEIFYSGFDTYISEEREKEVNYIMSGFSRLAFVNDKTLEYDVE